MDCFKSSSRTSQSASTKSKKNDESLGSFNAHHLPQKYSFNNERSFAALNKNVSNSTRIRSGDNCNTIIRQLNEYSYMISLDSSLQIDSQLDQSTIERIHRDLATSQDALLTNDGLIHMKEYALDGYQCRCANEPDRQCHDQEIDSDEHSVNYQLKF